MLILSWGSVIYDDLWVWWQQLLIICIYIYTYINLGVLSFTLWSKAVKATNWLIDECTEPTTRPNGMDGDTTVSSDPA